MFLLISNKSSSLDEDCCRRVRISEDLVSETELVGELPNDVGGPSKLVLYPSCFLIVSALRIYWSAFFLKFNFLPGFFSFVIRGIRYSRADL